MQRERNLQENVLAVLQGKSVAQFQLVKRQQGLSIPTVPAAVTQSLTHATS